MAKVQVVHINGHYFAALCFQINSVPLGVVQQNFLLIFTFVARLDTLTYHHLVHSSIVIRSVCASALISLISNL